MVTAPSSGAEVIPFLKTYVNLPGAVVFTVFYSKLCNSAEQVRGVLAESRPAEDVVRLRCVVHAILPLSSPPLILSRVGKGSRAGREAHVSAPCIPVFVFPLVVLTFV